MGIAQKISKKTVMRVQTGLGDAGSATGQVLRRTSSTFSATRDMYSSNEVVSHHQSTGDSYGLKKTSGSIAGELSSSTYQIPIEAILESDFAAVSAYNSGTDTVPDASGTFTDASGGYLGAGLKVGMVGRWTGWDTPSAANNAKNFWITGLTATVMTGVFLNGTAIVTDTATDDVTFTVVGKVCLPPLTSHTKNYLQVEEYYGDLTDSDLFTDVVCSSVEFALPASGNATFSSSYVGLTRVLSGTQVMGSPTAETETGIMSAINGAIYVNGAATLISGLNISVSNSATQTSAEIGSNSASDISRSVITVSGSFTSMLRDQVISSLYDAETEISIICAVAADETATADFVAFTLGKVKITGDAPDDSDAVMRTYPFTARINHDGGSALAFDETILTIQDSAAS